MQDVRSSVKGKRHILSSYLRSTADIFCVKIPHTNKHQAYNFLINLIYYIRASIVMDVDILVYYYINSFILWLIHVSFCVCFCLSVTKLESFLQQFSICFIAIESKNPRFRTKNPHAPWFFFKTRGGVFFLFRMLILGLVRLDLPRRD